MTGNRREELLEALGDSPIAIWGARMTGIGFARFAQGHGKRVLAFVDSDPAFKGLPVCGLPVLPGVELPALLREHPSLKVVIAVSIKEAEIAAICAGLGIGEDAIIRYSRYNDTSYTIDVVGTCNLKCASCVHSMEGNPVPKGIMPLSDFKRVLAKILRDQELVTHVSLYNWGEPFLNPELPAIVRHLHEHHIAAALSSNLSIRFDGRIDTVIRANPDYLKVSVSGFYPEAYGRTHAGGDINLVKSNLYRLRYLIDRYRAATFVDVNYHLYRDNNRRNLQKMRELCTELGFALSTVNALVMPLERVLAHRAGRTDPATARLQESLLVTIDEGIAASAGVPLSGCPYRDNQLNVNVDLSVPVCCVVGGDATTRVAENFLETTREEIEARKRQVAVCATCEAQGLPAYNMGFNRAEWDRIARTKSSTDAPETPVGE